jgi:hypothetical protein
MSRFDKYRGEGSQSRSSRGADDGGSAQGDADDVDHCELSQEAGKAKDG